MDDEGLRPPVGYKSPPVEHRFQKGQPSPNGKGRPRKNKAYQQAVLEALNRKVPIRVNGKRQRKVSVTEVSLTQLGNMAAAGNLKAIKEVNTLNQQISPLKPQPEMSPEELQRRRELAAKLTDMLSDALDQKAADKKDTAPRGGWKPPTPDGTGGNESN